MFDGLNTNVEISVYQVHVPFESFYSTIECQCIKAEKKKLHGHISKK